MEELNCDIKKNEGTKFEQKILEAYSKVCYTLWSY